MATHDGNMNFLRNCWAELGDNHFWTSFLLGHDFDSVDIGP